MAVGTYIATLYRRKQRSTIFGFQEIKVQFVYVVMQQTQIGLYFSVTENCTSSLRLDAAYDTGQNALL